MTAASRPTLAIDIALSRGGSFSLAAIAQFQSGLHGIRGVSGAGKTTLLAAIAGILRPDSGIISYDDRRWFDSTAKVQVPAPKRRVGLLLQNLALFPHMTTIDNVMYGLRARGTSSGDGAKARELAMSWLARLHIEKLAARYPHSLSGGEAQRVALARMLVTDPVVLLFDEPFSALDPALRAETAQLIADIVAQLGVPALLVTHTADEVTHLLTSRSHIENGRLVAG